MKTEEIKERVVYKATAKLSLFSAELKTLNDQLDNVPFGLTVELVQIQIESKLREIEVWKFILKSAQ